MEQKSCNLSIPLHAEGIIPPQPTGHLAWGHHTSMSDQGPHSRTVEFRKEGRQHLGRRKYQLRHRQTSINLASPAGNSGTRQGRPPFVKPSIPSVKGEWTEVVRKQGTRKNTNGHKALHQGIPQGWWWCPTSEIEVSTLGWRRVLGKSPLAQKSFVDAVKNKASVEGGSRKHIRIHPSTLKHFQRPGDPTLTAAVHDHAQEWQTRRPTSSTLPAVPFKKGVCFKCGGSDHLEANCREPLRCFRCRKFGHSARTCKASRNSTTSSLKAMLNPGSSPSSSNQHRPSSIKAFIPFSTEMACLEQYLDQAAFVEATGRTVKIDDVSNAGRQRRLVFGPLGSLPRLHFSSLVLIGNRF
ncbi:hypothetical protein COCNU_16G007940 [Cocos nucifera]|uniref:CCHC-type domain-containing protein n=1 Tax=Cocos nucifera TaxID=13894 RepID=A0A8K0IZ80_COCNU|nr:hypothetical protein COCNU_16G007940 [Cocos nucifera]